MAMDSGPLKIVTYPDSVLAAPAAQFVRQETPAALIGPDDEWLAAMAHAMWRANGAGIAAPQVGRSVQVFMIDQRFLPPEIRAGATVMSLDLPPLDLAPLDSCLPELESGRREFVVGMFFNPRLRLFPKSGLEVREEGCLSLPRRKFKVERHRSCRLTYTDLMGRERRVVFQGYPARVVQHEHDHLLGKTVLDVGEEVK